MFTICSISFKRQCHYILYHRNKRDKAFSDYAQSPLEGCAADAEKISKLLAEHEPRGRNFAVTQLKPEPNNSRNSEQVLEAVKKLYSEPSDIALFYFAGHGWIDSDTGRHEICVSDNPGSEQYVRLADLISLAENAGDKVRSKILILDCCHAGGAALASGVGKSGITHIPSGMTILAASSASENADAENNSGIFSSLLIDALEGGAADILGRVTPASVYTHIDQALGPSHQRPIYMANVREFIALRQTIPAVTREILYNLLRYFPQPDELFNLDPTFEPDRKNVPDEFQSLPVNKENTEIFAELQLCNRNGLIIPHDAPHMYDAAIGSKGCKLTRIGKHYWRLADAGEL